MLIGICSDKASPGATTTTLALASAWPSPAVVVEADPSGGDLAIRLRTKDGAALPEAPTVLSVAAAARSTRTPDLAQRYAHVITEGVSVIPGPLTAEQAGGVVDWEPLGAALAVSQVPVVVDLGRLHAASPAMPVAAMADLLVIVARPDPSSVIRLRERLRRLAPELAVHRGAPPRLFPVLVSPGRHGRADLADVRRVLGESPARPFIAGSGFLALDPRAVSQLEAGEDPHGRLARTALMRTARDVVTQVAQILGADAGTDPRAKGRSKGRAKFETKFGARDGAKSSAGAVRGAP